MEPIQKIKSLADARKANKQIWVLISVSILPCLGVEIGSPAILGSFVAFERRGGGEDPWLCVSDFRPICLYRNMKFSARDKGCQFWEVPKLESVWRIDCE